MARSVAWVSFHMGQVTPDISVIPSSSNCLVDSLSPKASQHFSNRLSLEIGCCLWMTKEAFQSLTRTQAHGSYPIRPTKGTVFGSAIHGIMGTTYRVYPIPHLSMDGCRTSVIGAAVIHLHPITPILIGNRSHQRGRKGLKPYVHPSLHLSRVDCYSSMVNGVMM